MYQVVKMYGDMEPWWFFDDWRDAVIAVEEFTNYYQALKYYKQEWMTLFKKQPNFKSKSSVMSAFWDPDDSVWCAECNDYLQQYHSVALLKDWQEIPSSWNRLGYEMAGKTSHSTICLAKDK